MHHDPVVASRKPSRRDEYIQGIPNRSVTLSEYEGMDKETRQALEESGLYELRDLDAAREAAKPAPPGAAVQDDAKADEATVARARSTGGSSNKKAGE